MCGTQLQDTHTTVCRLTACSLSGVESVNVLVAQKTCAGVTGAVLGVQSIKVFVTLSEPSAGL